MTGAAGFIGRHVVRRLIRDGHEVVGFDTAAGGPGDAPILMGDLRDVDAVTAAVHGHDTVCHIGAIGDVYQAAADPTLAAMVNVAGTANVAAAAESAGARIVYASTWEVYGRPLVEPVREEHPCQPDHPYSITKLAGEQLLLAADRHEKVRVVALRLGTAYGTGLRANTVFRAFIDSARRGEPLVIHGSGDQRRQFTHAADIADAFSRACRSQVHGVALNILAAEQVSVRQLADAVCEKYPTEIEFRSPRQGDVIPAFVSSERATERLGWRASIPFATGIQSLLDDRDPDLD